MGERQTKAGVWLPATFTDNHIQAVLKYLDQGRWALSRADWQWALASFDLLHDPWLILLKACAALPPSTRPK